MARIDPQRVLLNDGRVCTIRIAQAEDAARLLEHIKKSADETTFLTFAGSEFTLTVEEEAQHLQDALEAATELYLVAVLDEQVIGNLFFRTGRRSRTRHAGEFGMAVQQAFWGQGVGSALLDGLIAWGQAHTVVKKINLKVRVENARAIALYEKKGFVREGVLRGEHCIDGVLYDLLRMALFV